MAETAHFRGDGGGIWEMDLPLSEVMREKVVKGYLVRVNADGTPYEEPSRPRETEDKPSPPAQSAVKAEWVGYAVRAHGISPDDAEALTKQDLIEKFGGQ
jgi:hypothetical protein